MKEDVADAAGGIDAAWVEKMLLKVFLFGDTFLIILLLVWLIQYIEPVRSRHLDSWGEMFARFHSRGYPMSCFHLSLPLFNAAIKETVQVAKNSLSHDEYMRAVLKPTF